MDLNNTGKFMSLILRHKPETIGIELDGHGWADVEELIGGIAKTREFNRRVLEEIVRRRKRRTVDRLHQKHKKQKGGSLMETWYYEVVSIDGDYANLKRTDTASGDLKLVARALLPAEIMEGTKLKYEMMQYEMI